MKIKTYNDAEIYIQNSGIVDWEFGGKANLDDLTRYIYQNWGNDLKMSDDDQFRNLLCDYLESVDEKIADYSLRRVN